MSATGIATPPTALTGLVGAGLTVDPAPDGDM
jgi:hypothetical protein